MEARSVFDRLSAQLDSEERRQMLASIRKTMESQSSPIASEEDDPPLPATEQVKLLGLWKRFVLFLLSVFAGREQEEVVRTWMLRDLEQEVHRDGGDAIDGRRRLFLDPFAEDVERLRAAAVRLEDTLRVLSGHRTELVTALAMNFFPGVHRELLRRTDEEYIAALNDDSERYLKRLLSDHLDDAVEQIPPDARARVRKAVGQADTLRRLAAISYSSMLSSFDQTVEHGRRCSFDYLSRPLTDMYESLVNLRDPVDVTMLETMVLLSRSVDDGAAERNEDEDAFQADVRRNLNELMESLDVFRSFVERYPLLSIVRIVRDDPWWNTGPSAGGEDWIGLYRSFFSDRIHRQVLRVSLHGKLKTRLDDLSDACGGVLRTFAGLPDGTAGVETRHWFLAAALRSMVSGLWKEVMPHLRIILTSGEFYKTSNRAQFNDAYNEFEKIPERIEQLETDLKPHEAWGAMLAVGQDPAQRTKMAKRVDQELVTLSESARTTVEVLVNILGGILYARPGSSYDTLANYGQIGGRRNAEFVDELKEVHRRLAAYVGIIGEIDALERRAVENHIRLESPVPQLAGVSHGRDPRV